MKSSVMDELSELARGIFAEVDADLASRREAEFRINATHRAVGDRRSVIGDEAAGNRGLKRGAGKRKYEFLRNPIAALKHQASNSKRQFKPRPGEVRLKDFLESEGRRMGVAAKVIAWRVQRGDYREMKIRRVNARMVYVIPARPTVEAMVVRPGEVRLCDFVGSQAARQGVSAACVYRQIRLGAFPGLKCRTMNGRVRFVQWDGKERLQMKHEPRPGEITVKEFVMREAERMGMKVHTVYMRWSRGGYPDVETRRVSGRVAFVKVSADEGAGR